MESLLAQLTLISSGLALLCLLALHFLSPEFSPSWRMISEYALGRHNGLLTAFFLFWGLASLLLAMLLWGSATSVWAKVGVALLVVSAIGEVMGGLFDVRHKLHGLAFALGVPSVPVAALLIGHHLAGKQAWDVHSNLILIASHATWVSTIVMAIAMAVMFAGFKKAGIPMGPDVEPPSAVPDGVIALGGYANRLLIVCYVGWLAVLAWAYLSLRQSP
jgi:Protein of unknown function (DUF998)